MDEGQYWHMVNTPDGRATLDASVADRQRMRRAIWEQSQVARAEEERVAAEKKKSPVKTFSQLVHEQRLEDEAARARGEQIVYTIPRLADAVAADLPGLVDEARKSQAAIEQSPKAFTARGMPMPPRVEQARKEAYFNGQNAPKMLEKDA